MLSFSFWRRWLVAASLAVSVFGLCMALFNGTPLFAPFGRQVDPVFWGASPVDDAARQFQQWVYGAWGATVAGWGIVLAFVAHYPFARKERWSWNALFWGLLVWFALDTSISIFHRVYFNAVFNTILLALAALPMVLTRREFA